MEDKIKKYKELMERHEKIVEEFGELEKIEELTNTCIIKVKENDTLEKTDLLELLEQYGYRIKYIKKVIYTKDSIDLLKKLKVKYKEILGTMKNEPINAEKVCIDLLSVLSDAFKIVADEMLFLGKEAAKLNKEISDDEE